MLHRWHVCLARVVQSHSVSYKSRLLVCMLNFLRSDLNMGHEQRLSSCTHGKCALQRQASELHQCNLASGSDVVACTHLQ